MSRFFLSLLAIATLALPMGCASKSAKAPTTTTPAGVTQTEPPPPPAQPAAPQPVKTPFIFWALTGFGIKEKLFPRKAQPPKAEAARLIGTIKLVNKEERFVLIDALAYQGAAPGDALLCIMDRKGTATLRLSPLRNPPFLIADILDGDPAVGDRVYKH